MKLLGGHQTAMVVLDFKVLMYADGTVEGKPAVNTQPEPTPGEM